MSVSLFSGEAIERSGSTDLHNLNQLASGVLVTNNGARVQPSFRGVTNLVAANASENNIAMYIDGIYQGDGFTISEDFANVANIQVLKGPQGALYGRNATGGAILVTTLPPSKTWTGKLEAGYGSFNEQLFSGYISGPITDRIRFSLTGYSRTTDGYLKLSDPTTGLPTDTSAAPTKTQTVRFKLEADVTDNLTATFGFNFDEFNDPRVYSQNPIAHIAPTVPAPPLRPLTPHPDVVGFNVLPKTLNIVKEVNLKLALKTNIGVLTSTSAYDDRFMRGRYDSDGTYVQNVTSISALPGKIYQTNLNYAIDAIKNLDLIVGGDYYNWKLYSTPPGFYTFGPNNSLLLAIYNSITREAYAFYADGTYHITDKLSLNVGGRFAHETSDDTYSNRTGAQLLAGTYTVAPMSKSASWKKFTPRASLRYAITPDSSVYFSFSQGFKSGQWPLGVQPTIPADQETINAYEVGYKLATSTLQLNAAAFYYDYKNIQLSVVQLDPTCASTPQTCRLVTLLFNGANSHIYGADGDVTWSPDEHFKIRVGLAYLHARYLHFPNASGTGLNAATGLNVQGQTQDWSGQQMARAPNFSGNVGVEYDLNTSFGDILLNSNVSFTTGYVPTNPSLYGPLAGALASTQRYRQDGYALVNAQITWTDLSDHFSIKVYGRNLTDKRYFLNLTGNASTDTGIYDWPRAFGVHAGYKF
jgi:iron complex outermembrane receptor protein